MNWDTMVTDRCVEQAETRGGDQMLVFMNTVTHLRKDLSRVSELSQRKRYNTLSSSFLHVSKLLVVVGCWLVDTIIYFALLTRPAQCLCVFLCRPRCRVLGESKGRLPCRRKEKRITSSGNLSVTPWMSQTPRQAWSTRGVLSNSAMTDGLTSGSREAETLPTRVCAPAIASKARWRRQMIFHGNGGHQD